MDSVQRLCKTGVLLKDGMLVYHGTVEDTIAKYQQMYVPQSIKQWTNIKDRKFDCIRINEFTLKCNNQVLNHDVRPEDEIVVEINFDMLDKIPDLTIGVSLFDERGRYIYRTLHTDLDEYYNDKLKVGNNVLQAVIPTEYLKSGLYNVQLDISRHNSSWIVDPFNEQEMTLTLVVDQSSIFSQMHSTGALIAPKIEWKLL
jgi:hypothetical protein